jgi:hypothetical protein
MYDTSKLSDAIDAVQDIRTALDYLIAAQEILKRHEVLSPRMQNELHYITNLVKAEAVERAEQLEFQD